MLGVSCHMCGTKNCWVPYAIGVNCTNLSAQPNKLAAADTQQLEQAMTSTHGNLHAMLQGIYLGLLALSCTPCRLWSTPSRLLPSACVRVRVFAFVFVCVCVRV